MTSGPLHWSTRSMNELHVDWHDLEMAFCRRSASSGGLICDRDCVLVAGEALPSLLVVTGMRAMAVAVSADVTAPVVADPSLDTLVVAGRALGMVVGRGAMGLEPA